ncbi:hypothetical protein ACROYT_G023280 [Oculina patagonica]
MGNQVSSYRLVNRGCPQGSALGPLLWNIFQNDLPLCLATRPSMYADDHQIYHSGHDLGEVTSKLSESADQATKWYESNLLAGNLKKYQTLNIGCSKTTDSGTSAVIYTNNQKIKTADTLKLLGVTIDSKLKFSEHVSSACIKASQRIGVLMRLRNLIPTKAKLQLYKSAVLPYLTYCHLVWHFCRASDARKLERLQERGLRAVYKNKHASYTDLLERAKLPTLANRRLQDICILMYKVKHRLCPNSICNIFNEHNSTYNLRQSDFSTPRYNTVTYGKHSLRYEGPKLWGKLSTADRSAKTLQAFTNRIRKKDITPLMDSGFFSVDEELKFAGNIDCFASVKGKPNENTYEVFKKSFMFKMNPGKNQAEKFRSHTGDMPLECNHCGKNFNLAGHLKEHKRSHTGEKPFVCNHCGKCFSQAGSLTRHKRLHTGEKPFECKECGRRFSDVGNLRKHVKTHTEKKPFECDQYSQHFKKEETLPVADCTSTHTEEKHFECNQCGKNFHQAGRLKEHQRAHTGERPFVCKQCGKCFSQAGSLTRHKRLHTGEKPFECKECGKRFSDVGNLRKHFKTHTGKKPFECDKFGQHFKKEETLHVTDCTSTDTDEKHFECNQCGKCFNCVGDLTQLKRTHTGGKPFECNQCGKCFSRAGHLEEHKRRHTGEKPFVCNQCGKCFSKAGTLTRHKITHTGEKPFECNPSEALSICTSFLFYKSGLTRIPVHGGLDKIHQYRSILNLKHSRLEKLKMSVGRPRTKAKRQDRKAVWVEEKSNCTTEY